MKNFKLNKIVRNIIQLTCFILLPGLFVEGLDAIKTIIVGLIENDNSLLAPALFTTSLLVLSSYIIGRYFCGLMCSFGTMGDVVYYIGNKALKINYKISEKTDNSFKKIKYLILLILIGLWINKITIFEHASPWSAFGTFISLPIDLSYAFTTMLVGTTILILIVIGSLFIERFFCRYLCPLGAVFSFVSFLKIIKLQKDSSSCLSCRLCTSKCKMGIPLYKDDVLNSSECILCMQCVNPCLQNNIKPKLFAKNTTIFITSIAAIATIGLYNINSSVNALNKATSQTKSNVVTTIEAVTTTSKYKDGVYQGTGIGFHNGSTTVSVTIKNDKITTIETDSYQDDAPYYEQAFNNIVNIIISNQDSNVDTVSGATYSSNGIIDAVNDALDSAKN